MISKIGITINCSLLLWEIAFLYINSSFSLHRQGGGVTALLIRAHCATLRAGKAA